MRRVCSARVYLLTLTLLIPACGAATSATHDDPSISTRVKIALLNDPRLGPLRIDARTSRGVVTLSGSVSTPADAARAVAVARRVAGAKSVTSELKVAGS